MKQQMVKPDPEATKRLERCAEEWDNWEATCSVCHVRLKGTLASIRAHGETHGRH